MSTITSVNTSSEDFSTATSKELDVYAAEFAKLVARHTPHRDQTPVEWLGRLPDEAFHYYQRGISTFGQEATTPVERRGRLYLIHTSLLFMWMRWGKKTARKRFRTHLREGTRRASSLVKLEYLRRAGVLINYTVPNWFYQPVDEWTAALVADKVHLETMPGGSIKNRLQEQDLVECSVATLSSLQAAGIIPPLSALSLE